MAKNNETKVNTAKIKKDVSPMPTMRYKPIPKFNNKCKNC